MVCILLAEGFEETEALAPCDILRRGGVDVKLISCTGNTAVKGSHGISVETDALFEDVDADYIDMLVIPGGMPGTLNLDAFKPIDELIQKIYANNGFFAAICAGPMVLGKRGLLKGKKAVCYPGFEKELAGANIGTDKVVRDGRIITAVGAGAAVDFGLQLLAAVKDAAAAERVKKSILY